MRRSGSRTAIGIEVGSRWIHAAQLSRGKGGWRLEASVNIPRSPDAPLEKETVRLAGVLERRGFAGTRAVVGVPHEMLLSAVLELPPRGSGAPVEQLAAAELARMHRREAEAMEVALWEIPAANRAASGAEYMVNACPHEAANGYLDAFAAAGLEVRALDLPQLALLRACAAEVRPAPAMDALLHVGYDRCGLMIVTDGVIAYERALEGAEGKALLGAATQRAGAPAPTVEEILAGEGGAGAGDGEKRRELEGELRDLTTAHVSALAEQLNTSFSYISRRYSDRDLGRVMLTGEFGGMPGLAARIGALGVEAKVVRGTDAVRGAEGAAGATGPSIVAAIGLAQHEEREAA
jgi:Tfp pilus assembly PilM family ATPase